MLRAVGIIRLVRDQDSWSIIIIIIIYYLFIYSLLLFILLYKSYLVTTRLVLLAHFSCWTCLAASILLAWPYVHCRRWLVSIWLHRHSLDRHSLCLCPACRPCCTAQAHITHRAESHHGRSIHMYGTQHAWNTACMVCMECMRASGLTSLGRSALSYVILQEHTKCIYTHECPTCGYVVCVHVCMLCVYAALGAHA